MSKASSYPVSGRGPADHDVRDQIVNAATEHFRRYGYEKTAVSDLAKSIGFSKAYIYKFFESKQAIGEMICTNCLRRIEDEVRAAVDETDSPPEKFRRMFKVIVEASLRLFFEDRKLYEIAASAATERWQSVLAYEQRVLTLLQEILQQGRQRRFRAQDPAGRGHPGAVRADPPVHQSRADAAQPGRHRRGSRAVVGPGAAQPVALIRL